MIRAEWTTRRLKWHVAFTRLARNHDNDPMLMAMLGTLAWGRYEGEPCASDSKDNAIFGAGFLAGARYVAMNAAAALKLASEDDLRKMAGEVR